MTTVKQNAWPKDDGVFVDLAGVMASDMKTWAPDPYDWYPQAERRAKEWARFRRASGMGTRQRPRRAQGQ